MSEDARERDKAFRAKSSPSSRRQTNFPYPQSGLQSNVEHCMAATCSVDAAEFSSLATAVVAHLWCEISFVVRCARVCKSMVSKKSRNGKGRSHRTKSHLLQHGGDYHRRRGNGFSGCSSLRRKPFD